MKKQNQTGVGRREFLLISSSTVIAAVAMGQVKFSGLSSQALPRRVSLGYAEPDAWKSVSDRSFSPNVMSADRVTSGDGMFIRSGARVSVRGYNVEPHSPSGVESMQLVTNYSGFGSGGATVYPFTAWGYTKETGAGSLITYTVPVDEDQHLRLSFTTLRSASNVKAAASESSSGVSRRSLLSSVTGTDAGGADPDAVTLTLLSESGMTKLQRGFYIIAPVADGAPEPDWSGLQIRKTDNGFRLFTMNGFDSGPAHFEYLILLVDYGRGNRRDPRSPLGPQKN